jgi:hypothetical protein
MVSPEFPENSYPVDADTCSLRSEISDGDVDSERFRGRDDCLPEEETSCLISNRRGKKRLGDEWGKTPCAVSVYKVDPIV